MDTRRRRVTSPPRDGRGRVLHVIKCLGYGGAERLLVDLVEAGNREDFEYEVAYVLRAEDALVPAVEATGTTVHALGATGNTDVRWLRTLRQLLKDRRYDVVHFHLPYAAALGQMVVASLPRSDRPAVVYTEHTLWNRVRMPVTMLMRATVGGREDLVAVSPAARDALPTGLRRRARVVVHGVDLSRSDAMLADRERIRDGVRREFGVPDDHLLWLTVANLRPEKGYDILLDAVQLVTERDLPVRFVAAGRGPLRATMDDRLGRLGVGDRFRFLGQRDDVLRLLAGADGFVLSSRHEGLPVALMEAASMGLPIVATAVGGVPEYFTDDVDACLVPPGDPAALADALTGLVDDPERRRRLGAAAKRRSTLFDISAASVQMEEIYRRLGR